MPTRLQLISFIVSYGYSSRLTDVYAIIYLCIICCALCGYIFASLGVPDSFTPYYNFSSLLGIVYFECQNLCPSMHADGKEADLSSVEVLKEPYFSKKLIRLIGILSSFRLVFCLLSSSWTIIFN